MKKIFGPYWLSISLLLSMILGGVTGYCIGSPVQVLKPLGDLFLNLLFTSIVPLIFFSVSASIARAGSLGKLGKISSRMLLIFILTSFITALYALIVVKLFPPGQGVLLPATKTIPIPQSVPFLQSFTAMLTVPHFIQLFSHTHIMALLVFSLLVGLAVSRISHTESAQFLAFLTAGEKIFMQVFSLIMYFAPIGFFAYFAVMIAELGSQVMESYLSLLGLYTVAALVYFFIFFSLYAYIAGRKTGLILYWKNITLPATTAIATCSSAAAIPANIIATKAMRVSPDIAETTIPLGAMIHKDGSVLGGMFKIAFLFGMYHLPFTGTLVWLKALGASVLVGTVMGAIPSGGMLGELMILTLYDFEPSALLAIAAISIIIDPIATLLTVTSNCSSSLLIARLVDGKRWFEKS